MIYNLNNEFERDKYKEYANKLFKKNAVVEIKEKRNNRSLKQNSYLYLLLGFFASEYGTSIEEVKVDFFKRKCNPDLFVSKRVNKLGNEVTYLRSSASLNSDEMTLAITRFRNWSSAEAGIYLPSADERENLIYAEQTIERNKEHLIK